MHIDVRDLIDLPDLDVWSREEFRFRFRQAGRVKGLLRGMDFYAGIYYFPQLHSSEGWVESKRSMIALTAELGRDLQAPGFEGLLRASLKEFGPMVIGAAPLKIFDRSEMPDFGGDTIDSDIDLMVQSYLAAIDPQAGTKDNPWEPKGLLYSRLDSFYSFWCGRHFLAR